MSTQRIRQLKIHGNIVNVPADVASTVTIMLPCLQCQTGTIKVNLKRKLLYKRFAMSLRSCEVLQAAIWLRTNSSLYKDEGVIFEVIGSISAIIM